MAGNNPRYNHVLIVPGITPEPPRTDTNHDLNLGLGSRAMHDQTRREGGGGEKFSRAPLTRKNTENGIPDCFFLTENMHTVHFWPAGGAYDATPNPKTDGEGHLSSRFLPLVAFGVSISRHTEWGGGGDRAPR